MQGNSEWTRGKLHWKPHWQAFVVSVVIEIKSTSQDLGGSSCGREHGKAASECSQEGEHSRVGIQEEALPT